MSNHSTRIKIKKGRAEVDLKPRPGGVALPGAGIAAGERATKKAAKQKGAKMRPEEYDLMEAVDEYMLSEERIAGEPLRDEDGDETELRTMEVRVTRQKLDTTVRVVRMPAATLTVFDRVYTTVIDLDQRSDYPVGAVVSTLLHENLVRLQTLALIINYRAARRRAVGDDDERLSLAARTALREWLKGSTFTCPATAGTTEDYTFRAPVDLAALASGLSAELGVRRYSLIAACIAGELSRQAVTDEEHEALASQWGSLLDEIETRHAELKRRLRRAKGMKS